MSELYPFSGRIECYGPCFLSLNAKGNSVWTDTFKAYVIFSIRMKRKFSTELLSEPVFYNENIKIANKLIKHTKGIECGVYYIAHFFKGQWTVLYYCIIQSQITFNGCICSMKRYIKKLNIAVNDNNPCDVNIAFSNICSVQKGTKLLRYSD